jgi:hypothetical protein
MSNSPHNIITLLHTDEHFRRCLHSVPIDHDICMQPSCSILNLPMLGSYITLLADVNDTRPSILVAKVIAFEDATAPRRIKLLY